MTTLKPVGSPWRTDAFHRLGTRLDKVVGSKTAKQFEPLKIFTVGDLMRHVPRRYFSGTELSDLALLREGEEVAVMAEVVDARTFNLPDRTAYRLPSKPRLEATITDHRGTVTCTFFGQPRLISYWQGQLHPGARGIFAGKVTQFNRRLQLAHPDFVILDEHGAVIGGAKHNVSLASASGVPLVGLYPMAGKLRTWTIADCAALALEFLAGMEDPLPESVRQAANVVDLEAAFRAVHQPADQAVAATGRDRLRFDEAFALQLTMAYRRADAALHRAVPRTRKAGGLLDAFDERLPFILTEGQIAVTEEIMADLGQTHPMQRLLQGEVGSGKTLVALRAMLAVVDAGGQAVLLAPTEVLAAQHFQTITRMLGELASGGTLDAPEHATGVVLITGSTSAARRRQATLQAVSGEAGIVIGTHALLSSDVQFADLGLVVVDEQHRFGVEQRAALSAKANARPHVLVMTATPIPRSVAMTVFGDLETSTLREIPAGRAEVTTVVVDATHQPSWVQRGWQRIVEEVGQGRQAYVVCARISSSSSPGTDDENLGGTADGEVAPAVAVEDLFEELRGGPLAGVRVEMVHGQLPSEEKDAVMSRFAAGETDVLVATTVVEVGVDVPNASVMVIHDADRFGISQLHQLRGRIGRGAHPGVCLLLTTASEQSPAHQRLDAVASTRDGFALAEVDLEQRREGDVLGASQSGSRSSLKLLRVLKDADLIAQARTLAEQCIAQDPELANSGLADIVLDVEMDAAGDWLERT
ncbi:MAG TPA: ATP-dependent DNA helicase RecG [Propionibacteriaceae bacterium]|jgi:ATP-dependent DNA helicase RecG|nr:ATP-dependent DNA helicase RecG [Propionibacteriaceae bacterium]